MEKLIKLAMQALKENYDINEIHLDDGTNKVRVIRNAPNITCWTNFPYQYSSQYPQY